MHRAEHDDGGHLHIAVTPRFRQRSGDGDGRAFDGRQEGALGRPLMTRGSRCEVRGGPRRLWHRRRHVRSPDGKAVPGAALSGRRRHRGQPADASRRAGGNVLFARLALENAPAALAGLVDRLTVLFPWGSLLRALAEPQPDALASLRALCTPGAEVRFVFEVATDTRSLEARYREAGRLRAVNRRKVAECVTNSLQPGLPHRCLIRCFVRWNRFR
jgi:hypothetical protein